MTAATKEKTQSIEDRIEAALQDAEDPNSAVNNDGETGSTTEPPKPAARRRRRSSSASERTATETEASEDSVYKMQAFTNRDVPWMKICPTFEAGTVTNALEASRLGGLDFDVKLVGASYRDDDASKKQKKPVHVNVASRRACVREDNGTFFSYVSEDYKPIQYREAFAFMDEVSPNYVAAGSISGGKKGFMVVQMPEQAAKNLEIAGVEDPFSMYVVLRTSHDLTRALEVSVLALRGKCMNSLTLSSFSTDAVQRWSVKHVGKDPMAKLNVARDTLARADAYVHRFEEVAVDLASIKLDIEAAKDTLKRLLPDRPKRGDQINAIVHAWQESPTNGFRDNGWGLTNAVSEYFEWGRNEGTRTAASRFTGALDGQTHKYINRTAQLLLRRSH